MRVQIIYGEHTKADFRCRGCRGTGRHPANAETRRWACMGAGNLVADQRTYTYEAPEGTKLWQILITPTPDQGGKRGTVVKLGSDYDGPCREAYSLPTFPCKGNCGTVIRPGEGRSFCDACWARVPEAMKAELHNARGFRSVSVNRAIADYLTFAAPAPPAVRMESCETYPEPS